MKTKSSDAPVSAAIAAHSDSLASVLRLLPLLAAAHVAGLPNAVGGVFRGAALPAGEMKLFGAKNSGLRPDSQATSFLTRYETVAHGRARPGKGLAGRSPSTLIHPKTCPTIGVHLTLHGGDDRFAVPSRQARASVSKVRGRWSNQSQCRDCLDPKQSPLLTSWTDGGCCGGSSTSW